MSDTENEDGFVDLRTGAGWLSIMGIEIGDEVMIIPVGGNGSGFQGTLVELIVGTNGPAVFVIEKLGSPRVTINWSNATMISKVIGPSSTTVTPEDLVKMADENGIDVPDAVRQGIADLES